MRRTAPGTAADLSVRALELTLPGDADRYPRLVRAAGALTAAARLDEAAALVRDALAQPLPAGDRARLRAARSAILGLQGRPAEANTEAGTVLAWPDVPEPVRDEAVVAQLQALGALGENQRARAVAQDVLALLGEHGELALAGALTVLGADPLGRRPARPGPAAVPRGGAAGRRDLAGRPALPAAARAGRPAHRPPPAR